MPGGAVGQLGGGDVDDALAGAFRDQVHEAEQILVRIAEAHAAAGAGLVIGGGARHVERDHALVLVPDVDHAVQPFVAGVDAVGAQQVAPVVVELGERGIHGGRIGETAEQLVRRALVDDADLGRIVRILPFVRRVDLDVAEHEHQRAGLARGEFDAHAGRGDRRPAVGHRIVGASFGDDLRGVPAVEPAEELVAARVEPDGRRVHAVERVMVAAFLELGLMVDHGGRVGAFDLHLAGGEVALEVAGVVDRVPQAPFHGTGHLKRDGRVAVVGQVQAIDLGGGVQRHEGGERAGHAGALGLEHGIADAVTATVGVQRGLGGQERGRPG